MAAKKPSQRWAALLKKREEQVFLLVTLLIGTLLDVALQDVPKLYGFAPKNTDD